MSGGKYVDSEGHLYTVPIREQGNIYKPNNKAMADEMNEEKQVYDAHTKEIDLVNRDPKHLNDDVVKCVRNPCVTQLSGSCPGPLTGCNPGVKAGVISSSKCEKTYFQAHSRDQWWDSVLLGCWIEDLMSPGLLARVLPQFLPHRSPHRTTHNMAAGFQQSKQTRSKKERKMVSWSFVT
ncbi:caveolin-1 isoform X2 [Camelus dromedarius]|uniref:caveolin-1 isoform X2 n=1 Tax=Camelus dromedarius TaxID=9838 RepID=UPI00057BC9AF|nr:caveolin-1 isoform X2 [Camelus dromedarius]